MLLAPTLGNGRKAGNEIGDIFIRECASKTQQMTAVVEGVNLWYSRKFSLSSWSVLVCGSTYKCENIFFSISITLRNHSERLGRNFICWAFSFYP